MSGVTADAPPARTGTPPDPIETLVAAASDAIRNQAPPVTCDVGPVRGLLGAVNGSTLALAAVPVAEENL